MIKIRSGAKRHLVGLLSAVAVFAIVGCGATPAPSSASSTPDVAAAQTAALTIYYALPGQTPEVWVACSQSASDFAACPFSPAIKTRLAALQSAQFFGDAPPASCGEDYITGTQNGLFTAPTARSATAQQNGSVVVVISRGSPVPDFTVTMTSMNGAWLATDLASGTGPSASILSAKPNC